MIIRLDDRSNQPHAVSCNATGSVQSCVYTAPGAAQHEARKRAAQRSAAQRHVCVVYHGVALRVVNVHVCQCMLNLCEDVADDNYTRKQM